MKGFYKFMGWIIGIAFFAQFMAGMELNLNYNKERATKVKSKFWQGTVELARNLGDIRRAIF